ncbi:hypothetical protein D6C92_02228 [Aureobasidium pullulans]|nr:hypothetical protein D6C92_02228 [Aureobasidium pullulans]
MSSKSSKIISPYFAKNHSTERPTPDSDERVYTHLLLIPSGRITSYAILASQLHSSPRAVGGALRRNPYAPMVPCHRVIAANGF